MTAQFTLVFETSTPLGSLAMIGPSGELEQRNFTSDRSHNALLFEPLSELVDSRLASEIGLVIVGSGPGSYSGTRVGIAAAQGVAMAAGCPAVAIPSILGVASAENGAACLAIGDARRGSFWTSRIEGNALAGHPELTDADGLHTLVSQALGDGLAVFSFEDTKRFPLRAGLCQEIRLEYPSAEMLWRAWLATAPEVRQRWTSEPPQPIYLKPPHITPAKRSWLVPG
jgi:tRNA threonylcarbamoyl adenosine modification protein YeaZ